MKIVNLNNDIVLLLASKNLIRIKTSFQDEKVDQPILITRNL